MNRVRKQIGCRTELQALSNNGFAIAVLDTGVAKHPDLEDKILGFHDFIHKKDLPYDDSGHGTHVCGIACGSGKASEGIYCGIAPQTNLVVGKVLDKNGDGNLAAMVKGIEWVIQNKEKWNIRILNVSVGVGKLMNQEKESLLCGMLEEAWRSGLIVVCAAGNNGPAFDTLSDIGKSPYLITVGCHDGDYYKDKQNCCASYSGRGGKFDTFRKPDVVAPGTEIVSCNYHYMKNRTGYKNAYCAKSGTSMATPIVSGALALLLGKHPTFDNETAKRKLLFSATDLQEPWYQQGWGMVNISRLLE